LLISELRNFRDGPALSTTRFFSDELLVRAQDLILPQDTARYRTGLIIKRQRQSEVIGSEDATRSKTLVGGIKRG
jgi:hypothetical protein